VEEILDILEEFGICLAEKMYKNVILKVYKYNMLRMNVYNITMIYINMNIH